MHDEKQNAWAVDVFNAACPPGTPVILTDDFGKEHSTATRSQAWQHADGHASVLVDGRSGGYSLWRIKPAPPKPRDVSGDEIAAIAHRLATQDNACTADPIFIVQQRERVIGFDPDYSTGPEDIAWMGIDWEEFTDSDEEWHEAESYYEEHGQEPEGWTRTGYQDRWVFVQPFFTRAGAEAYIEANSHRLTDPRVFVDSAYRNPEWKSVVAFLPVATRCIRAAHAVAEYLSPGQILGWDVREAKKRLRELREALNAL